MQVVFTRRDAQSPRLNETNTHSANRFSDMTVTELVVLTT